MDMIKIQKNGNGFSIMIPARAMRQLNLQRSDVMGCEVVNGELRYEVIRKHAVPLVRRGDKQHQPASNREVKS